MPSQSRPLPAAIVLLLDIASAGCFHVHTSCIDHTRLSLSLFVIKPQLNCDIRVTVEVHLIFRLLLFLSIVRSQENYQEAQLS